MPKYFILDTNVLLHNSNAVTSFADNVVVLPMTVIEEGDKVKKNNDELGRNARTVIRTLDSLRTLGSLGEGVVMENGGMLKITVEKEELPGSCIDLTIPDNLIIATAFNLKQQGFRSIFVSKDINARLKADALGLEVMDFEQEKADFDTLYSGWRELQLPSATIDSFYQTENLEIPSGDFYENEFVRMQEET